MIDRFILSSILMLCATAAEAQSGVEVGAELESYPIVLTPTRLRQSLQDVPGSVTIITSETLRKFGVTTIPDALRLVPGMAITQATGSDFRINYHGTNILQPRRMNVLIDGVSVYQPAFARVDWRNLPITIEDIDRIEVTRGPNSAAYGPNSMTAIVNIITRHPGDVGQGLISSTIGTRGTVELTGRFAAVLGPTSLRITVNSDRDHGYNDLSRMRGGPDTTALQRLNVRSQTRLSDQTTLDLDAGYVGGTKEIASVAPYETSYPDQKVNDRYLSATIKTAISPSHELQARASYWNNTVHWSWTSCMPTAFLLPELFNMWRSNPSYANAILAGRLPSGGTPQDDMLAGLALQAIARLGPGGAAALTCVTPNQDLRESRYDLELQDTYVFSDQLRAVGGFGARQNRGTSQTALGGSVANTIGRVFGNAEYKPWPWLGINAGAYAERDEFTGTVVSPRVAANVRLSNAQALRFVWSTGSRTPDIYEQRANSVYVFTGATPPLNGSSTVRLYQSTSSPGGLSSERISSREIGYLLNVPKFGLMFDAKVFDDRLTSLISEKLQVSDFSPSNSNNVHLRGVELQANSEFATDWTAFAHYGYLDNRKASTPTERSQYSRHSGGAGIAHEFGNGWSFALAYYGASGNGLGQNSYGREDLVISKKMQIDKSQLRGSFIVRRLDNKSTTYFRDAGSTLESSYSDRLQFVGQVQFGF